MNTQDTIKANQNRAVVELIYKEKEVADILHVSCPTLKRLRYAGEINFLRIGTQVRYTQQHLDDYLQRCERKSKG